MNMRQYLLLSSQPSRATNIEIVTGLECAVGTQRRDDEQSLGEARDQFVREPVS